MPRKNSVCSALWRTRVGRIRFVLRSTAILPQLLRPDHWLKTQKSQSTKNSSLSHVLERAFTQKNM